MLLTLYNIHKRPEYSIGQVHERRERSSGIKVGLGSMGTLTNSDLT